MKQESDLGAIESLCSEVIAANPKSVEDYRAGKAAAINFLKGQVMKLSKGKANPNLVGEMLVRLRFQKPKIRGEDFGVSCPLRAVTTHIRDTSTVCKVHIMPCDIPGLDRRQSSKSDSIAWSGTPPFGQSN